jgi:hypothetical protein
MKGFSLNYKYHKRCAELLYRRRFFQIVEHAHFDGFVKTSNNSICVIRAFAGMTSFGTFYEFIDFRSICHRWNS